VLGTAKLSLLMGFDEVISFAKEQPGFSLSLLSGDFSYHRRPDRDFLK